MGAPLGFQEPGVRQTVKSSWCTPGGGGGCTHLARTTAVATLAECGLQARPKGNPVSFSQVSRGAPTLDPQISGHQSHPN